MVIGHETNINSEMRSIATFQITEKKKKKKREQKL